MQFREICSLKYSIILSTFWVDLHSYLLQNALVKPKNCFRSFLKYVFTRSYLRVPSRGKICKCKRGIEASNV